MTGLSSKAAVMAGRGGSPSKDVFEHLQSCLAHVIINVDHHYAHAERRARRRKTNCGIAPTAHNRSGLTHPLLDKTNVKRRLFLDQRKHNRAMRG